MVNIALLVLLAAIAVAALWPYWQFARGRARSVPADARIVLREVHLMESRESRFVLRGEILRGPIKARTFSVFPWHSDNIFGDVEAAQQAARLAGIQEEVIHSVVAVRGIFGTHVHATARMSESALRQLKMWSAVACVVPIVILIAWLR
jgi:hypothetical protein